MLNKVYTEVPMTGEEVIMVTIILVLISGISFLAGRWSK